MKRRKISELFFWLVCLNDVLFNCWCLATTTEHSASLAVNKFQSALHQQNTFTILSSIEERLRSLDNVYSMQLSQNLEIKLDQYNRKLENLDNKIMRLEALVMLNLGKVSENISTKNFKDDLTKTDILRKLDSTYEGVTHRLNYIERKLEVNSVLFQEKLEAMFNHLDKMDKDAIKRDSDLETEVSAAISGIKNLTTTYKILERKVMNVTEDELVVAKHTLNLLTKYNMENRKSMNKLHDNIVGNLQYLDNRTTQHLKISDDTNTFLKQMKIELKEDFNSYANKVADMNSDMWKNTDTTEDDLKNIGIVVNSTKVELQNGVRSLMIQIGKLSHKDAALVSGVDYKDLDKKLTANIEKILTNQDVFLESCHRLQMDESQIESEISVMLNKLIDMLEKKLSTEAKDMKNFEKNLKSHDNRINRNMMQANQNIISLFEKSTVNSQLLTNEIRKVGTDINALFTFVQTTINDGSATTSVATTKIILDKLILLERTTRDIQYILYNEKPENVSNYQIHKEIQRLTKSLTTSIEKINNSSRDSQLCQNNVKQNHTVRPPQLLPTSTINPLEDDSLRESIAKIFGEKPKPKRKCKQNVRNLIDIRAGTDCEEQTKNQRRPARKRKMKYDIDIRADVGSNNNGNDYEDEDYNDTTATTTEESTTTEIIT
ncbi:unnamed protein product [Diabrotica balteata]|uniref:Uncharacterized protein n=1 Tax=Diabrotica balteata TaxID=107213 RepID=A0A9N9SZK0_DIABA|nr:unnamed protein product [Diabrotica balteata]